MLLDATDASAIERAADILAGGGLLGLPTETVYGLAARADDDRAVAAIFAAKGRPAGHPLIVHVADTAAAEPFVQAGFLQQLPDHAAALMRAFWPGPLTVIVPRREGVANAAAGRHPTIGLRSPAHPAAQAVLRALLQRGVPGLAAPSANRFGSVSPTTAQHVLAEFGDALPVLDGGACQVGIESTIIDCTRGVPVLLRPGAISREDVQRACGQRPLSKEELPALTPRASGTLLAHYAPTARVRLMDAKQLQAGLDVLGADAAHIAVYARAPLRAASSKILVRRMPDDAAATAQQLFAALRGFDEAGVKLIWIETPPDAPAWEGVRDRLQRAAAAG